MKNKCPNVAILSVKPETPLPALSFGDPPKFGDETLAIGHPAMASFWVPILGRIAKVERGSVRVDMPSFFGMSVSPFLNLKGETIGLIFGTMVPRAVHPIPTPLDVIESWEEFGRLKSPVSAVSMGALIWAVDVILQGQR